jgi:hypothetical protein
MILLAQADDPIASRGFLGLGLRSPAGGEEESWGGIAAEVMTEDMEGAGGVTEGGGDGLGGPAFDEVGAQRLVLALFRGSGLEEEAADFT